MSLIIAVACFAAAAIWLLTRTGRRAFLVMLLTMRRMYVEWPLRVLTGRRRASEVRVAALEMEVGLRERPPGWRPMPVKGRPLACEGDVRVCECERHAQWRQQMEAKGIHIR